jgi:tRNA threonylcarbamoyladenosine biosynthesis protein TsaE
VFHFDLYRLRDPEELEHFGIRDYLEPTAVLLFEWPENGVGHLPEADVEFRISPEGQGRRIAWQASSARGRVIVTRLESGAVRA